MKWGPLKEGFDILDEYLDDDSWEVNCGNDQIYVGPSLDEVSEEDRERLRELGWFEDAEFGCFSAFV